MAKGRGPSGGLRVLVGRVLPIPLLLLLFSRRALARNLGLGRRWRFSGLLTEELVPPVLKSHGASLRLICSGV
jgi:hypothetical protein